jgi:hypothetical protein
VAANTNPIFSLTPNVAGTTVNAALTKSDGTGTIATDIFKCLTAGANGSWISKVRFSLTGTTAATASAATVFRVYVSSKTSGATTGGTDTFLVAEVSSPAQTTDSASAATYPLDVLCNFALTAGWTILVSSHAANAANTSHEAVGYAGDF